MKISDFENELKLLNPNLSIRPNNPPKRVVDMFPDVVKLASVLYFGEEICTMPNDEIYDEKNGNYGVDLRDDGRFVAHRTRPEVLEIVKQKLFQFKNDKEYADALLGRGVYSEAELRKKDEPAVELVDEIKADIKEVKGQ